MTPVCNECGNKLSYNRPDVKFCSPACCQSAYRKRHGKTDSYREAIRSEALEEAARVAEGWPDRGVSDRDHIAAAIRALKTNS